ncbi:MAG TPA: YvcK family protein [Coriobacteriia bacterium]|nr:YvcK family protein [Coriobacteriia bacterium]
MKKRAVVIGGGTGAPVSIRALLRIGADTSAVVAMSDDGGSTGMLRTHTGIIPPGDIRKCLVAMARDPHSTWVKTFKKRYPYINNHSLGNLIITALYDNSGSFTEAIGLCAELLDAQGNVYPSTLESVVLRGRTRDGRFIDGQANICKSDTALSTVSLDPAQPRAHIPALQAIRDADLIVLGPGSLFTSIIPNLLVPGVVEAIREGNAITLFLCSLADMQGETWGLNAAELVEALLDHGMRGLLDIVVMHKPEGAKSPGAVTSTLSTITPEMLAAAGDSSKTEGSIRRVLFTPQLARRIESRGPMLITRDLVDPLRPTWHDITVLSEVLDGVLRICPSQQR